MPRKSNSPLRPVAGRETRERLSSSCARAERELRLAERDLRHHDPLVAAAAAGAFAALRQALEQLRAEMLRQSGH